MQFDCNKVAFGLVVFLKEENSSSSPQGNRLKPGTPTIYLKKKKKLIVDYLGKPNKTIKGTKLNHTIF